MSDQHAASPSTPKQEALAIVGIAKCGKVQGVMVDSVDSPNAKRELAKFVAQMVRHGLRIETWTIEQARSGEYCFGCEICNPKKAAKRKALAASTQTEAEL